MVSGRDCPLTRSRRRAVLAFLIGLAIAWWHASTDQLFYVVGLEEPWSTTLGPALSAISSGLVVAMVFSLVDAAAGLIAASVAVIAVLVLPGYASLHHDSLNGPPLVAVTLMMAGVMIYAPRWSIAYGALAAVGAVFVAPAGLGLPLAALAWAVIGPLKSEKGVLPRLGFVVLPLVAALALAHWTGDAWLEPLQLGWRGGFDTGLRAAGTVLGDQMTPTISTPALRWFAIADLTLLGFAVVAAGWRQVVGRPHHSLTRRLYSSAAVLTLACCLGLAALWLFAPSTELPSLETVFSIVILSLVALVVSVATMWPRWPTWGRLLTLVIAVGWLQAAVRV